MADSVDDIRKKHEAKLLKKRNVVAVGEGKKITNGIMTEEYCITVFVTKKISASELKPKDVIPTSLEGLRTDVIQSKVIKAQDVERHRPAPPGSSMGHYLITAGTFGAVVYDVDTGQPLILTNNHVGGNSNEASPGDAWLQPGPYDGGKDDGWARLVRFKEIYFTEPGNGNGGEQCNITPVVTGVLNFIAKTLGSQIRLVPVRVPLAEQVNRIDAAVGLPGENMIVEEIPGIGKIAGVKLNPGIGDKCQKKGRTTDHTTGQLVARNLTSNVQYGEGKIASFTDQYAITGNPFSQPGDSGSIVLSMENEVIGLLFAGSDEVTIVNPISFVMQEMMVEFK